MNHGLTVLTLVKEVISDDRQVIIKVTGSSMYPFLRNKKDRVLIVPITGKNIRTGDIVLLHLGNGKFVLHRVIKKNNKGFYLAGDAQIISSGPHTYDQSVGIVSKVWRGRLQINPRSLIWRLPARMWIGLFPFRHFIIKSGKMVAYTCGF